MRKHLLLLGLALVSAASIAVATQQQFMFGVWNGMEGATDMSERCAMLHDTLHMNTVLDNCVNDYQLGQYSNPLHPLKVMIANHEYVGNGGMNGYLRLYALAPYAFFESEGTEFAASHLRYIGGRDTTIGGINCRYFQATANPPDSLTLIQTGPGSDSGKCSYNQMGWYAPQFMNTQHEPAHLQYRAFLRFKLGPRTGPPSTEPIAAFYIAYRGGLDEFEPGVNDTLIEQTPIYLFDSQFDSAGTEFVWCDSLKYSWNNTIIDSYHTEGQDVYDVMFNVRWSGRRDIYIDKIKVMDNYGKLLWEDTTRAYQQIDSFVTRFYDTSATVLGWYLMDDQSTETNCNNVYSARRVDSLLTNRFSHKPAFIVPGAVTDFLSIASYSNASFWFYPIRDETLPYSDCEYDNSVQRGWDDETIAMSRMRQLADSKGVPLYATLQSCAKGIDWLSTPTPEENLCQVNLALAYHTQGILYFRYGGSGVWDDTAGHTDFWYSVRDVVGPYIDKMGPIFASLEWKHAWKWGDEPPANTNICYISCDQYGDEWWQDPLYLQVAQFGPASHANDTAYFFLVNRRCLPEESISGTLGFRGFAGSEKALTVYYVTDMLIDSTWQCDSHNPPDPPHTFNYAILPGAGRLYRVTAAPACLRGDADGSSSVNVSDAVFLIAYVFAHGEPPDPMAAGECIIAGNDLFRSSIA